MKIVGAPEYGDVSKYLITCKRLIIIYPKSLMKSIAIVTTVKDELPKGGSDVVSIKMNVFSLSLYETYRTSFVSLDCNTAASTSSLMLVKLYFPSLLVRQKCHRRDMMVWDISLLKDSNMYRGEWRLCESTQVFPGDSCQIDVQGDQLGVLNGPQQAVDDIQQAADQVVQEEAVDRK